MRRRARCEALMALMAVPPSPAQPGSAPVFGRYAGVQGVQTCRSAARRGFEACFSARLRVCRSAASDIGIVFPPHLRAQFIVLSRLLDD